MLLDKLSKLVENSSITQSEFEALSYQLAPQQQRLFLYLESNGLTNTIELSRNCSLGNVSDVASNLNKRLKKCGDSRQVICLLRPHTNKFGQKGVLGNWQLVWPASNDA